jgi:hypothetical protein
MITAARRSVAGASFPRGRSFTSTLELHKVHNTIHRFFHILDGMDTTHTLHKLFLPGGTLSIEKAGVSLREPAEIDAWCARMRSGWDAPTLHTEGNIVLNALEPGVVTSTSTWSALVGGTLSA